MAQETDYALLFYLLILVVVGGAFVFGDLRNQLTQSLQHAVIWVMIFLGAIALYSMRDTIWTELRPTQAVQADGGVITLRRANDGHFYASLGINGHNIDFVVDTGATGIVLTQQDADRIGLAPDELTYFGRAETANGTVKTAYVRLDEIRFADRVDRDLPASVNGGDLHMSLLGMTYLSRFTRLEIEGRELRLHP